MDGGCTLNKNWTFLRIVLSAGCLATYAGALETSDIDLKIGGYFDGGRFQLADTNKTGEIVNRMGAKWKIEKPIDELWSVHADIHWYFWRSEGTDLGLFHIAGQKFNSDMQAAIQYKSERQLFRAGQFNFKYNPDSKNLGEYLVRSEAYPTILESSQGKDLLDYSNVRVLGFQYGWNYPIFRMKTLLFAEQYNRPR